MYTLVSKITLLPLSPHFALGVPHHLILKPNRRMRESLPVELPQKSCESLIGPASGHVPILEPIVCWGGDARC